MAIIAQFVQDLSHDYSHDSQFLITNFACYKAKDRIFLHFYFILGLILKLFLVFILCLSLLDFFYLCVQYFEMHPYVLINELTYLPSDTWNCILRYLNFKGFKALSRIKMCTSNLDFQEEFIEIMLKFHV